MKSNSIELILIRHCESEWSRRGLWQGQVDVPLSKRGEIQSLELTRKLANTPPAIIYSSPLRRTLSTAQSVAQLSSCRIKIDSRLKEIRLGVWEGLSTEEIAGGCPALFRKWQTEPWEMKPPEGESLAEVSLRVYSAVDEIVDRHDGERVAIVTHLVPSALLRLRYCNIQREDIWRAGLAIATFEVLTIGKQEMNVEGDIQ